MSPLSPCPCLLFCFVLFLNLVYSDSLKCSRPNSTTVCRDGDLRSWTLRPFELHSIVTSSSQSLLSIRGVVSKRNDERPDHHFVFSCLCSVTEMNPTRLVLDNISVVRHLDAHLSHRIKILVSVLVSTSCC